ncbi:MAG: phosphoglycerate kinase [bacterium]|nr:phosphoglycerate kinase [bacterium]
MRSLTEAEVNARRVLLRADFDIDLEEGGLVSDFRIRALFPSLDYLISHQAKTIVLAHWGRPDGKVEEALRLSPQFIELQKRHPQARKLDDCLGPEVEKAVASLDPGGILVLENLRFYKGEQENSPEFAQSLAELGDLYVNDAFAVCHRAHASIVGLPKLLPSYAGLHLQREVEVLGKVLQNPARPLVVVMSGVKAADKIPVANNLAKVADWLLLAGTLQLDPNCPQGKNVIVPADGEQGLDVGPQTIDLYKHYLSEAKTILWNGSLGRYEDPKYETGTKELATFMAESPAFKVAGGGSTLGALTKYKLMEKFDFVSTGGGSMLEFLSGNKLPGITALG